MKGRIHNGYVVLHIKKRFVFAHRIVWEAIHGEISKGLEINHKNSIRHDNRIQNLEAVTPSENVRHSYSAGFKSARGERNGRAVLTFSQVVFIRNTRGEIPSAVIAETFGISDGHVRAIRTQKAWRNAA